MLSITFLLSTVATTAQPTLTNQNLPNDGDSYTVYTNTNLSAGSTPGASGANVTWDFSTMNSGTSNMLTYSSASSPDYPNANIEFTTQGTSTYFDVLNDAYTYYGFYNANATSEFSDGQDQIRVPMSYNDNYTDPFSGVYDAFGQTFDRTGSLDVTYDGYGTLSTPQGTYNNVIRIRIARTSTDEMNGQTMSNNVDSIYFWYNEFTGHPIMTYTINYVDGNEEGRFANYIDDSDVVLSTPKEAIEVKAYPNPAKNIFNIKTSKKVTHFDVYDVQGSKVLSKEPGRKAFNVNISALDKGTYFYFLRDRNNKILSRKKLTVQ